MRHRLRYGPLALAALALPLTLGCGGVEPPEPPPLVLISIDTLRSDHLPAYGYEEVATPAIDALAADGVVFERAFSHSPLTLPAHASMLTGLLPPAHGVRGNIGYRLAGEGPPTLPARLAELGYETAAGVSSFVLRRETGIGRGFELFEDQIEYRAGAGAGGFQREGPETLAAVLPWLRSQESGPFFLFLHLYEPHTPYEPPADLAALYSPYDGEVAAADRVVEELVRELRGLGRYDETAIVVTSDHGEGLGDHGEDEHGVFLYRESLQVPLILKLPAARAAGERVAAAAQLVDLPPTLLELAGAGGGAEPGDGDSLLGLLAEPSVRTVYSETYYPRFYFGWSELRSLFDGRFHYIESPEPELFDLDSDPAQRVNLVATERRRAAEMRDALASVDSRLEAPEAADAETWRRLASLGYVGHGQSTYSGPAVAPQTQVQLLTELKIAFGHAIGGQHAEAVSAFEAVLEKNPLMLAAWEQLGRSNERLGRPEEALTAFRRAIELAESAPHLRLAAARLAASSGRLEEARVHAEAALAWDESSARSALAQIALTGGDPATAEREARRALALRPSNTAALLSLARSQLELGRPQEALELIERREAESEGPVANVAVLKASILARLGRFAEAEVELEAEIGARPSNVRAYSRLALLLARQERAEEIGAVMRRLVEANTNPRGFAAAVRTLKELGDPDGAAALARVGLRHFPGDPALERLAAGAEG